MKKINAFNLNSGLLAALVLLLFPACFKVEGELPPLFSAPDFHLSFFRPADPDSGQGNYLQSSIQVGEGFHFGTFGYFNDNGFPSMVTSLYLADEVSFEDESAQQESILLLDPVGQPAFVYDIDAQTGQKGQAMVEFEPAAPGMFYMRFYYYDWENRIGTLLMEMMVERQGDEWITTTTFLTDNANLEGLRGPSRKGGSFAAPIRRLEELRRGGYEVSNRGGLLDDWVQSMNNLVQNDIGNFLSETVQSVGIAGLVVGGIGTLAGSPAAGVILIGGFALTTVGYAVEYLQTNAWDNLMQEIGQHVDEYTQEVREFSDGIVETLQGYDFSLDEYWNQFSDFPTVRELIDNFTENEIPSFWEDLDDLPDTEGVVHVALSWNTNLTDIDLWVTDPFGERIYYEYPSSASGGYLDLDDVDGFGPENIYWANGAPDGDYLVQVHYYGCDESLCPGTQYTVKVSNGLGDVRSFEGTLNAVDVVHNVVSFRKNGKDLEF
ncbi:MAG: hypothetical protein KDD10_29590 [Phaeodactylibacter sp.]|nr:hypothetical protein [Phaeodactylibacter sp.]MCB9297396.1 hypothetical protein [Lewinellaceae bacterium]